VVVVEELVGWLVVVVIVAVSHATPVYPAKHAQVPSPVGPSLQVPLPLQGVAMPPGHSSHVLEPGLSSNVPGGQSLQLVEPI
jgi:hypothetical protein